MCRVCMWFLFGVRVCACSVWFFCIICESQKEICHLIFFISILNHDCRWCRIFAWYELSFFDYLSFFSVGVLDHFVVQIIFYYFIISGLKLCKDRIKTDLTFLWKTAPRLSIMSWYKIFILKNRIRHFSNKKRWCPQKYIWSGLV